MFSLNRQQGEVLGTGRGSEHHQGRGASVTWVPSLNISEKDPLSLSLVRCHPGTSLLGPQAKVMPYKIQLVILW